MTSAVLSNINEPQWVETHRFNPKPYFNRFNPNHSTITPPTFFSNPNPNFNFTQQTHVFPNPNLRPYHPPIPAVTASLHGEYVTYNLASYSKRDLKLLKTRLVSELQRVQTLRTRIETGLSGPTQSPQTSPTLGKTKKNVKRKRGSPLTNGNGKVLLMKKCGQILTRLMKHKHGWVFNKPVDAVVLRLHDYHHVIKRPMDLGTVKSNLQKNVYKSPLDFAADVRLTFENAMVYNPKGQDVYAMAETLLLKFEQSFNPVRQAYEPEHVMTQHFKKNDDLGCLRKPTLLSTTQPPPPPPPPAVQHCKKNNDLGSSQKPTLLSTPQQPPPQAHDVCGSTLGVGTTRGVKMAKLKVKEVNKRGMNLEEKKRLGMGLRNLPEEKVDQVLMIIKKRNNLMRDGDNIELDFDVLDNDTLWELDMFVSYHQSALSNMKRKQVLVGNSVSAEEVYKGSNEEHSEEVSVQKSKKGDEVEEEDVDIGEEYPVNNYPPIEIEKDCVANASTSSTSSSYCSSSSNSKSSSSDPDSGSSAESDSDDDERVQPPAPFVESKEGLVT